MCRILRHQRDTITIPYETRQSVPHIFESLGSNYILIWLRGPELVLVDCRSVNKNYYIRGAQLCETRKLYTARRRASMYFIILSNHEVYNI